MFLEENYFDISLSAQLKYVYIYIYMGLSAIGNFSFKIYLNN